MPDTKELFVEEPLKESNLHAHDDGIIVYDSKPTENVVLELHDNGTDAPFVFELHEVPGAPNAEPIIVPHELEVEEKREKDHDSHQVKEKDPWDWHSHGYDKFVPWLHERFCCVPKHSGKDSAGLERALNYLNKLDGTISEAMRVDLDGKLNSQQIEEVRDKILDGIERLNERLEQIESLKYKGKKRKKKADLDNSIVKEAQRSPGVSGIVITVPLFISRIARTCINGTVSAGHDLEELLQKQIEEFDLSKREVAECLQLLSDMGYPLHMDRLYSPEEKVDLQSSDNGDFAANYPG